MAANVFDLLVAVTLLANVAAGWLSGFIVQFTRVFSLVAAFWAMSRWTDSLAPSLSFIESPSWRAIAAGVVIFFATLLLVGAAANVLRKIVVFSHAGWLDKLLGAATGLLLGVAVWTLIIIALEWLFPNADFVKNSQLIPWFNQLVAQIRQWLPADLAKYLA